jgi:PAS domain S-box-containing protein
MKPIERPEKIYLFRSIGIVLLAIVLNIALGYLVKNVLDWPLYLDSIGTILVGALLGPLAGAATGAITNIAWYFILSEPTILPFTFTAAFIGWAAGFAVSRGAFERFNKVVISGLLVGAGAALISVPIAAYLFGSVAGSGMEYLTSYLNTTGANLLQTLTIEGLISDPLDKVISFVIAWLLWRLFKSYFRPPSKRGIQYVESLQGYSMAIIITLLASLICFVFLPAFGRGVFAIFYLAVLLSAWRGGLGPALFTAAIGTLVNILFLVSPYYDERITPEDWLRVGVFVVVSASIAAITDQLEKNKRDLQRALQAERESQARMRAITDGVDEALALISPDQRIINVNQRFVEIFGVPQERITGQHLGDIQTLFDQIFAEAGELYELILTSSQDTGTTFTRYIQQNWPQIRELQLYSTPIRDAKGFLGRLFVFRDVTHEREVDRMKTEFVSLVSHELRTPLTSIKGFTEMILDGDAGEINEEVEEFLGIVFNNAERLVALVNDLLDISRIESGRIQLKSEKVDIHEIVRNAVDTMQQKIKEKDQTLVVKIDPAIQNVLGDKDKLVQVLTNYLSNAYKYTQAGGALQIDVSRQGEFVLVAVSDNGFGISPEDQQRLFTRFYRVDNSMTREVGGTGLGLSIVKQLIEIMGGEIGVRSALGKGSTFSFTVPLFPEDTIRESEPTSTQSDIETTQPEAAVLVIEDDPEVSRLIAHHLQKAGYQVQVSHNTEEALASLQENLPDLITLDIDLPGIQGDELARQFQENPLTSDIPILILSVFVDDQSGIRVGGFALSKPIDQEELLATVAQMLHAPQPGKVLVIDDDQDTCKLLSAALTERGFQVETASDGESGLERAKEGHPGLILLDMRMPGMDGFSVLRSLKNLPATAEIPVIAMTGSHDLKTTARARLLALGASDFITKPFDMNMLVEEIRIFIKT